MAAIKELPLSLSIPQDLPQVDQGATSPSQQGPGGKEDFLNLIQGLGEKLGQHSPKGGLPETVQEALQEAIKKAPLGKGPGAGQQEGLEGPHHQEDGPNKALLGQRGEALGKKLGPSGLKAGQAQDIGPMVHRPLGAQSLGPMGALKSHDSGEALVQLKKALPRVWPVSSAMAAHKFLLNQKDEAPLFGPRRSLNTPSPFDGLEALRGEALQGPAGLSPLMAPGGPQEGPQGIFTVEGGKLVGDLSQMAPGVDRGRVIQEISNYVERIQFGAKQNLEVSLIDPEIGQFDIRVAREGLGPEGGLSLEIQSHDDKGIRFFRDHRPELAEALQLRGIQLEKLKISGLDSTHQALKGGLEELSSRAFANEGRGPQRSSEQQLGHHREHSGQEGQQGQDETDQQDRRRNAWQMYQDQYGAHSYA